MLPTLQSPKAPILSLLGARLRPSCKPPLSSNHSDHRPQRPQRLHALSAAALDRPPVQVQSPLRDPLRALPST
ncbi:hypothetical protein TgHK011_005654 [Trichoderma gracile]|nr:hypothetical protein TgHK011_005654 [Trichoderma gracile]